MAALLAPYDEPVSALAARRRVMGGPASGFIRPSVLIAPKTVINSGISGEGVEARGTVDEFLSQSGPLPLLSEAPMRQATAPEDSGRRDFCPDSYPRPVILTRALGSLPPEAAGRA